ncbi:MAG: polysaccharide biosynthesis/export family protein [Bacteroidota bacterium]
MKLFSILFLVILLFSCDSSKELIYFQDNFAEKPSLHTKFNLLIKKNDILEINILTSNLEATLLFSPQYDSKTSSISYTSGVAAKGGYLVDQNGMIELPYIGKISAEGKTIEEFELIIQEKLSEYLIKPLVKIQLINFKVTVLGDVRSPGTFNVPNHKISLIEAIGVAGDLNLTGARKIQLIRETSSGVIDTTLDLTSKQLFSSEFYFLRQNDIIYVPQGPSKISYSNFRQLMLPILSGVSIVVSTVGIFLK